MSYKRLIIKLQKMYAHYDVIRKNIEPNSITKDKYDLICDEIDHILTTESYGMKKYFKY